MSDLSDLFKELERVSIPLDGVKRDRLLMYYKLLLKYNRAVHLTSKRDPSLSIKKNLFDVAILDRFLPPFSGLIDLGAGAGFAGIVSKILRPEIKVIFVERNSKKASFLSIVSKELGFSNVEILTQDWKDVIADADVGVSKASCGLDELITLMPQFLKPEGILIHYSTKPCLNADKFYQYFSPYSKSDNFLCVYFNKRKQEDHNVPRGTSF